MSSVSSIANVSLLQGDLERLQELDLEPASFDLVVSNCVVNLCTEKLAVLSGVRRLLRPGGEFHFTDPRLVSDRPVAIIDPELLAKTGEPRFCPATQRLFNIEGLEDACENHGQAVIYRGSIAAHPHLFPFDKHHAIEAGRVFPVCGNTYRMLAESRFAPHCHFIGDFSRHYGLYPGCGGSCC